MQACDAVLASKDLVISEMVAELKFKDEEYQLAIEQQSEDITDLVAIMARQVRNAFSLVATAILMFDHLIGTQMLGLQC